MLKNEAQIPERNELLNIWRQFKEFHKFGINPLSKSKLETN